MWRKSSHSRLDQCVEVRAALTWRKSSHSASGNCVEVAATRPHRVA